MSEDVTHGETTTEQVSGAAVQAAPDAGKTGAGDVSATSEAKAGESLLTAEDSGAKAVAPADFPDDWREKLSGGDESAMKQLGRFKSPNDVYTAYRALQQKMSSGEVTPKLTSDATEEQVAEYRAANGIPEKAEGYLEKLDGLVVGDDDKELVSSFLSSAHAKNASPEVVGAALEWYYGLQEEMAADQSAKDKERRSQSEDALRAEWGNEYRGNINSITAFLDAAPTTEDGTPLGGLLLGARLADGSPLGDNPAALKWLASLAHDANPAGFVSPAGGGSQAQSIEAEINEIRGFMRTNRSAYNKDEGKQQRLRDLLSAQERMKGAA